MASTGVAVSPSRDDLALAAMRFDGSRSPHCSPESILIYLAVPGSPLAPMRVLNSDSIVLVKLRIQNFKGFVVKNQKLVFDGRELARNDCLVRDYGVAHGNVLHVVIRLSHLCEITVKTICGKKFKLQVEQSRNVGYIKQEIAKRREDFSDTGNQKLVLDGEELEDHRLVTEFCKNNDAVVQLLICKTAKVRIKHVDRDLELSIIAPDVEQKLQANDLRVPTGKMEISPWVEPVVVNPKVGLSPSVMNMIQATFAGLEKGYSPVMSSEGTGGAYFMQDASGQKYVAVFKPVDEEPMAENNPRGLPLSKNGEGLKRGTRVGEGAFREVAAYILDHPIGGHRKGDEVGFAGVPPTVLVRCLHGCANHADYGCTEKEPKMGSLQMFMKNSGSCEDMGPRAFPVEEVHKIAVLDMRLANADRHAGNILIHKDGDGRHVLIPIDHGYCLPESFEDCTFEWLYWPQAHQPFNVETLNYINSLDAEEDIKMLRFHGWELPLECARVLRISTMLLKKGAERGLTPFKIGSMLCREDIKHGSKIEEIIEEAKDVVLPGMSEWAFLEAVSEVMDCHLDELLN